MVRATRDLLKKVRVMESGTALVTVLGAMVAVTTFAVAVTVGVTSNFGQSNRDRSVKRALAASEAGVQEARYRMNMLQPTSTNPCVTLSGGVLALALAPGPGQWCGTQTVTLGTGVTARYQISPYRVVEGTIIRNIVSTGTVNGVSRRTEAVVGNNTGAPLFQPFAITSDRELRVEGSHASVTGPVRSNEDIVLAGSHAEICGPASSATPGPGHRIRISGSDARVCNQQPPAASPFVLNPVDQGDAPTHNDNANLLPGGRDRPGGSGDGVTWNPTTRQLSITGSHSSLTLTGHTYSLCKLTIAGSHASLIVGNSAEVRIFFDSPSNCTGLTDTRQLDVSGSHATISNPSFDPTKLQIYMLGNGQNPNSASLSGSHLQAIQMTFYAPNTDLELNGSHVSYSGAIVARRVTIQGSQVTVEHDSRAGGITQTTIGVYRRFHFFECTPTSTGGEPDSGC